MRAGVYVRISRDRSGARGGVTRQLEDCATLCERRGWDVVDVYEDNDVSAFSGRERPAYERLMGDVADGLVDVVVAWHTDRLWRSVIDQQVALAAWRDAGLAMVSTCSGGDVDPSSADDGFVSTVMAAVAEKESADKSRRVRRKIEQLVADGHHHGGGSRPFGHSPDRRSVVKGEARLLVEACERVCAGESVAWVAWDWRRRGIATVRGGRWSGANLTKLLRQPRLAGLMAHRGRTTGEARWPAVVDRDLWERTQAALDARSKVRSSPSARSLLAGVLVCGRCSAPLLSGTSEGRRRYRCRSSAEGGCGGVSVPAAWAEELVVQAVLAYVVSPGYTEAVTKRNADAAAVDEALAAVSEAEQRLATLDAMFSAGEVVGGDYRTMRGRLSTVADEARERLAVASGVPVTNYWQDWGSLTDAQIRVAISSVLRSVRVAPVGHGRKSTPERLGFEWR